METKEAVLKLQARQQRNNDPKVYSIKRLFKSPQRSSSSETPRFMWSEIAKHAGVKSERWQSKNTKNTYRIDKLFRHNEQSYIIEKVREYYNQKYKNIKQIDQNGKFMVTLTFFNCRMCLGS